MAPRKSDRKVDALQALDDSGDDRGDLGHVVGGENAEHTRLNHHRVLVFWRRRYTVTAREELHFVSLELVALPQLVEDGEAGTE